MERIHPDGFFEAVFPDRSDAFPYRLAVENHEGHAWEFVDPYQFGPVLTDFDLHLLGEGTHYRNFERLGAHLRDHEGFRGRPFRRLGPERACGSAWSATSTTGTAAGTRCGTAGRAGSGRSSSPTWSRARSTSSRSRAGTTATSSRSPTPTASPPSCGPRRRRSSGTSPSFAWHDDDWMANRRERQGLDSPIAVYEVHLGSWKRKLEDGEPLPHLPRAGRRAGRAPEGDPLHPRRAAADQRAPVRRELGLSAGRLLRADVAVRHARRLRLFRRHAAPERLSA